jgi:hypothetical protein
VSSLRLVSCGQYRDWTVAPRSRRKRTAGVARRTTTPRGGQGK